MKRSGFKRKPISEQKPMRRTRLRVKGDNDTALKKDDIQHRVRLVVVYRDGGCILRDMKHKGEGEAKVENGKVVSDRVIQADHLVTRSNAASFSDTRLIVCVCRNCHGWKKYNKEEYDELVKSILPKDRVELWEKVEKDRQAHKTYKLDLSMAIVALDQELKQYEN